MDLTPKTMTTKEELEQLKKKIATLDAKGVTKREYFAGLAMQGLLASNRNFTIFDTPLVEESVIIADRLLQELKKIESNES